MLLPELASGALFGLGLFSSGVYMPQVIQAQFSFTSNVMITTMMGASAASALIFDLLHRLGYTEKQPATPSNLGLFPFDGNLLGGLLIGVGMASTGACPGTTFVQAGAGSLTGMLVILGGLLGALTFVKLQDGVERARAAAAEDPETKAGAPGSPRFGTGKSSDIAAALGVPPVVLLLVWVPMCLAVMRVAFAQDQASSSKSYPGLIPPTYGGLVIGLAQLVTVLLTGHAIGASRGYEDVARWLESKFSQQTPSPNTTKQQRLLTGSVTFSLGIFCSAAILRYLFVANGPSFLQSLSTLDARHAAHAMVGGWAMVLGARIARGCTSGHGISGLSKFSLPSLVTTASMFGAGVVTAAVSR